MTPVENNLQTKISKKLLVSLGCISRVWFQAKFTGLKSSRFFQRNCFETKKEKDGEMVEWPTNSFERKWWKGLSIPL